jgi:hypothetical protein
MTGPTKEEIIRSRAYQLWKDVGDPASLRIGQMARFRSPKGG